MVFASGLRSDALDDEQAWPLQTPNLTRLTENGRGLRAVAASASPCQPGGMISLLTGLHARQHGRLLPGDEPNVITDALPHWLAEAGYFVAGVGAVQPLRAALDEAVVVAPLSTPEPEACDYFKQIGAAGLAPAITQQRRQRLRSGPFETDRLLLDPHDDVDGFIARQARQLIERLPTDRPWALIVIFTGPGNDLPPPPPYGELVNPALLTDGFAPADLKRLDALAELAYPRVMLQRLEPHTLARIRGDYLARVALIDHGVGRLVEAATSRRDAGRTWTVVASDCGYLLGEHGLIGRQSFLAGAIETPLIIRPPRRSPQPLACRDEGLLSTVDVSATLAALAGADLPPWATGRSVLPSLKGKPVPALVGGLVSEFNDRLMLETERYKIVFDAQTGGDRACLGIFDLLADPQERRNLSEAAAGQNLVDALRQRVADVLLPLRAGCSTQ